MGQVTEGTLHLLSFLCVIPWAWPTLRAGPAHWDSQSVTGFTKSLVTPWIIPEEKMHSLGYRVPAVVQALVFLVICPSYTLLFCRPKSPTKLYLEDFFYGLEDFN